MSRLFLLRKQHRKLNEKDRMISLRSGVILALKQVQGRGYTGYILAVSPDLFHGSLSACSQQEGPFVY